MVWSLRQNTSSTRVVHKVWPVRSCRLAHNMHKKNSKHIKCFASYGLILSLHLHNWRH